MDINYREAIVEVLDILEHTNKFDVNKISPKFIEFLKKNRSQTYKSKLNYTKSIKDMNLNPKTQAILGLIYVKFWADKEEKEKFIYKINENERIFREKRKKSIV